MGPRRDQSGTPHLPDLSDLDEPGPPTEALHSRTREQAVVRRFTLRVVEGPDAGLVRVSTGGRVVVGTHRACDLRLADRTVSRFHCEVAEVDGRIVLRDLGSRNGTRVDGVEVTSAPLRAGAALQIGGNRVRFEIGDERERIPLSDSPRFGRAVGHSPAMRAVFAVLEKAATTDTTVLLSGETGAGKDILAESIHQQSARSGGPFVVVDCGALPPGLLETEIFGHEKGAFTGAERGRPGAFEAAAGGTVFLDEIGELDLDLQPKLLRVIERRELHRVGAVSTRPVDVRIVAATSRNLLEEVNAGRFRSDLYYRLAVVSVSVPPLRDRKEDLPLLAEALLDSLTEDDRRARVVAKRLLTPTFLAGLSRHAWPGNVRELRNYLERCLALQDPSPPGSPDSHGEAPTIDATLPMREAREKWLGYFERRYLEQLLQRHGDNVTAAARAAGMGRMQLYRLLWRAGLR